MIHIRYIVYKKHNGKDKDIKSFCTFSDAKKFIEHQSSVVKKYLFVKTNMDKPSFLQDKALDDEDMLL